MQESNNIPKKKSINSDLMNLREDYDQFRITINPKNVHSFNETFTIRNSPKTFTNYFPKKIYFKTKHNNLLINKNVDKDKNYNINFNIEDNIPKHIYSKDYTIKKIKKISALNDKIIYKNALDSIKKFSKSKTQVNFFSPDNSQYYNNLIKKKFNKTNEFNSKKYHTIYFNSSLDNFYIKKKNERFKTNTPLNNLNKTKYSIISPRSHCVNFIDNIMKLYNKAEENKNTNDIFKIKENISFIKNKKNDNKKSENEDGVQDKKVSNILGIDSFNHITLKNLFQKNSAKIKNGVLNEAIFDKNIKNNDIFLNPFTNSYGVLLDYMSEKVGFMKGSMDIIYPKITQKKYQIRNLERKKKPHIKKSASQENYKIQNNEINNIFNIKPKKTIIQSIFTKYPINIKRNGKNIYFTKKYSVQGRKGLMNNTINNNSK